MSISKNSFKQCLQNLFNSVDFFTVKPSDRITFKNKQNYTTKTGKTVSWMLIILIVLTFVNFGGDMIYRENPQSVTSQVVTPDPEYLNLAESGFFIAFGLEDLRKNALHYIDETIYTVKMIQRTKIGTNFTLEEIPLQRCSIDRVPNRDALRSFFVRNQINNLYCISDESKIQAAIQSVWEGPLYKNILINIYPCKNSSDSENVCKPAEEIQTYLNYANYAMYFTNLAVDPNKFEKPISSFVKNIFTPISSTTLTYIELLFTHLEFISDDGYLFKDLNYRKTASYNSFRQVLSFNPNMVVQIDIKLDKIKTIYTRNYRKFQNVLADTGGIIKSFIVLGNILVLPLIELKFRLAMANSLFTFKTLKKEETKSKSHKKKLKVGKGKIKFLKPGSSIISTNKNEIIKEYFNQDEGNKLKISYFSYFCSCCRNEFSKLYHKLLNRGLSNIDQMLDISFIMNKLTEIDMLKVLLFDETQKDLFEYIPKPKISINDIIESKDFKKKSLHKGINENLSRSNTIKAKLAFKAFEKISEKKLKSSLDEKLLMLVPKLNKVKNKTLDSQEKKTNIKSAENEKFLEVNENFSSPFGVMLEKNKLSFIGT